MNFTWPIATTALAVLGALGGCTRPAELDTKRIVAALPEEQASCVVDVNPLKGRL